jgi:hypothetical protein
MIRRAAAAQIAGIMNLPERGYSMVNAAGTTKPILLEFIGAMTAIVLFVVPVHAASAVEDCAAKAAVIIEALKQTSVRQIFAPGSNGSWWPGITEAEFAKACEDQSAKDLERMMTAFPAQEIREIVALDAIPKRVRDAFVAAEDATFYRRGKADFEACTKYTASLIDIAPAQRDKGQQIAPISGSAYTAWSIDTAPAQRDKGQRVAPVSRSANPLCYSRFSAGLAQRLLDNTDMSLKRKYKELLAADRVEAAFDKPQILQHYLNWVYLGRGAYGVAAASRRHFGKPLNELTVDEAAFLAGLAWKPMLDAARNYQAALERRNWVIGQMAEAAFISRQEAETASARPLTVIALNR